MNFSPVVFSKLAPTVSYGAHADDLLTTLSVDPVLVVPDPEPALRAALLAFNDFDDADRGFIAALTPCVIKAADGRVVWDNDVYVFLRGEAPTSVPSATRASRWRVVECTGSLSNSGITLSPNNSSVARISSWYMPSIGRPKHNWSMPTSPHAAICSQISGVAPEASHRWAKPRLWRTAIELRFVDADERLRGKRTGPRRRG